MNRYIRLFFSAFCICLAIWYLTATSSLSASGGPLIDRVAEQYKAQSNKFIVKFNQPPLAQVKQTYRQRSQSETNMSPVDLATQLNRSQKTIMDTHARFINDLATFRSGNSETAMSPASGQDESDNESGDLLIKRTFSYLFNGVAAELDEEAYLYVKDLSYVDKIYPDRPVTLHDTDSNELMNTYQFTQVTGASGAGIVIAIIDTGVDYLHPDLGSGIGPGYKVLDGYDFINDDNDPMDDNGHGTHCAGIAAANGVLKGVAPNANLLAYKVLNTAGNGIFSDIIAALERAADPDENPLTDDAADVVSISIGGYGDPDDSLSLAVDAAVADGIVCVIAAGNEYNYYSITSPGCARDAITVGAADSDKRIASFSSRGPTNKVFLPKPDVVAPGVYINSTLPDGAYGVKSGTSMATPHVAGAAALILEAYPSLQPLDVKNLLRETATTIGEDALTQGSGFVNLENMLNLSAVISPSVVYLDSINNTQPTWQANTALTIKNLAPDTRTYTLSWESDIPPGLTVSFSSDTVILAGGTSTTVTVYLSVDTAVLPSLVDLPYIYDGFVVCHDTTNLNDYRVQLLFQKEQPDPFEPNNYYFNAHPVTVSTNRSIIQATGRTKIDPESGDASNPDYDWFAFTAQAGDYATIDINALDISSPLDAELILYDDFVFEIDWNADYNYHLDPMLRNVSLPYSGTYYIQVAGEYSTGSYQTVTSIKPADVEWFTSISGLLTTQLLEGGSKLLNTYSSKIEVLDTTNYGLQLWQVTGLSPVDADASESGNLIAVIDEDVSYQLLIFDSSTSVAQWQYTFPSDQIPSDVAVSRDGTKLAVYCEDDAQKECIIYVFNRLSSFPEFVHNHETRQLGNAGFSISADGSLVVFSDLEKTYILDTNLQALRWAGTYAERAYTINNDGTYLTGSSESTVLTLRKWNGANYEKVWDFNPGNDQLIFRTAISGNGEYIVTCQRLIAGFYGLDDDGIVVYVFHRSSGTPLYEYRMLKNRDNTPTDDLFGIPVPNAVDEILISPDGSQIAVTLWGADPEQPEILFFSPEYPEPIGSLYTIGSVTDASLVDDTFCYYSEGKHNFHFFRFFVEQELAQYDMPVFLAPVPPFIRNVELSPHKLSPGDGVTFFAAVTDSDGISGVQAMVYYDNDTLAGVVALNDTGSAPDQTAGDTIYSGTFTTDAVTAHSYYVVINALDMSVNTAESNTIPFTTEPAPYITVTTTTIEDDTALHPGTKSKIEFTLSNSGTAPLAAGKLTMSFQDPYIDDYYLYSIDIPSITAGDTADVSSDKLYITPTYTVPHNYTFTAQLAVSGYTPPAPVTAELSVTDNQAPYAHSGSVTPKYLNAGETILFKSTVIDGSPITATSMIITDRDNESAPALAVVTMYDNGMHGDEYDNDGVYAASWTTDATPRDYAIQVYTQDSLGNIQTYEDKTLFTTKPFVAQADILLVNDTENEPGLIDTYTADLDSLSLSYDIWDTPTQGEVPLAVLNQYRNGIVFWVVGLTSGNYHVSTEEQDSLIDYLDGSGNLIITGQRLSYHLTLLGQQENALLKQYLSASFVLKDTNCLVVDGINGNVISDGYSFTLENQAYTGEINPIGTASALLKYDKLNGGGVLYSSGSAAVLNTTETFRTVLFDFDIAGLRSQTDRRSFLGLLINYMTSPKITEVTVTPTILNPGEPIHIQALAYDDDAIQSVNAKILDSTQTTELATVQLFDDGAHNDGNPGDNLYANSYTTSMTAADHYVAVHASDTLGNESQSIEPAFFSTLPNPNLVVTDVTPTSTDHFAPNTFTYFDITVFNNGTLGVSGLTVSLQISDQYVQYYSTLEQTLPAIGIGASASTAGGKFYLKMSSDTPHGHQATLNFTFTDTSDNTYHASYAITVQDTLAPVVSSFTVTPRDTSAGDQVILTATVVDGMDVASVTGVIRTINSNKSWNITLYDDGLHNDSAPGDFLFGATFTTDTTPYSYLIDLTISDALGNSTTVSPIDRFTTVPFDALNTVLVVDDTTSMTDQHLWIQHYFISRNLPCDVWKTRERGELPASVIAEYDNGAVIWYTGKSTQQSLSVTEIQTITGYLDNGGNMLFTGEDNAYYISSVHGNTFLNNYFAASFLKRDITVNDITGVASDPITDGMSFSLSTTQIPGEISVSASGEPIFYFDQSAGSGNIIGYGITGCRLDSGTWKTVFLDFSWDGIMSDQGRKLFMERTLDWFGIDQTSYLTSVSLSPDSVGTSQPLVITAAVDNTAQVDKISAQIEAIDEQPVAVLLLFDDGTHGDPQAGDGFFTRSFLTLPEQNSYYIDIEVITVTGDTLLYNNIARFTTRNEPALRLSGYRIQNNGVLQPGSTTYFGPAITNIGHTSAANVQCKIELQDEYVSYYRTSALEYGTIAPGSTIYDQFNSFYISLASDCPHNYTFNGHVTITDASGSTVTDTIFFTTTDTAGPVIENLNVSPKSTNPNHRVTISASIVDGSAITSATAHITLLDGTPVQDVALNYESAAQMYIGSWNTSSTPRDYKVTVSAEDSRGNASTSANKAWFTSVQFNRKNPLLLVLPPGGEPYEHPCKTALESLGYGFDIWDRGLRGDITTYISGNYADQTVIYCCESVSSTNDFTADAQQRLIDLFNNGGKVLLSGSNVVYTLTSAGTLANTLIDSYFQADYVSYKMYIDEIIGQSGGIFDNDSFILTGNRAGEIAPIGTATGQLKVDASVDPDQVQQDGFIAVSNIGASDSYRSMLFNFNLKDIDYPLHREQLLEKTILWMNNNDPGVQISGFSVSPFLTAPSGVFTFTGTISALSGVSSAELKIYDQNDSLIDTVFLYDDGAHSDGAAGDAVFGGQWTSPATAGYFYANLSIENGAGLTFLFKETIYNFSTQTVPRIEFDSAVPSYGSLFFTGTYNYFDIYLTNTGNATAYDVKATISSDDPRVSYINTSVYSYGNIDVSATKKQNGTRFYFSTTSDCPDGAGLTLTIRITVNGTYVFDEDITIIVNDTSPPYISNQLLTPKFPSAGQTAHIDARVTDGSPIITVRAELKTLDDTPVFEIDLYDDGLHNDGQVADDYFGNDFVVPAQPNDYTLRFYAEDELGNGGYAYSDLWFSTKPFVKRNNILIVDYHTQNPADKTPLEQSLTRLGYAFDTWKTVLRGQCDASVMAQYIDGIVLWDTKTAAYSTFTAQDQQLITGYLDNDGKLIMLGEQNVYNLSDGGKDPNAVLDDYFKVLYIRRSAAQKMILGDDGDVIGDNLRLDLQSTRAGEIEPLTGAEPFLYLYPDDDNLSIGATATRVDNGSYKAVLYDFQFDTILYNSQQNQLIDRTIEWCGADVGPQLISCSADPLTTSTGSPVTISAQVSDTEPVSSVTALLYDDAQNLIDSIQLYDDATHGDSIAGDFIFTTTYTPVLSDTSYQIDIEIEIPAGTTYLFTDSAEFFTYPRSRFVYESMTLQTGYTHFAPGSSVYFGLTVRNDGTADAHGASAVLKINDPQVVSYSTFAVSYGSCAIGVSKASTTSAFRVQTAYTCPNNYTFTGTITVTDNEGNISQDSVPFTVQDTVAPYPSAIALSKTFFKIGEQMVIEAEIKEGSGVASADAIIENSASGYSYTLPLNDAGYDGDSSAGDGIYTGTFTIPFIPRDYSIQIHTEDALGNWNIWPTGKQVTSVAFTPANRILLLDDDGGSSNVEQQYFDLLDTLGYPYDYWNCNLRGDIDQNTLMRYIDGCVLLFTGSNTYPSRISQSDQATYMAYLEAGGSMIVSGSDNSYLLTDSGTASNIFLNDYLHAQYQTRSYNLNDLTGVAGTFSDGMSGTVSFSYGAESDPIPPGISLLKYTSDSLSYTLSSATAAILTDTGAYKTLLFDFKFVNITDEFEKMLLLQKAIDWMLGPHITDPSISDMHPSAGQTIDISCSVSDSGPISSVTAHIEQPDETIVDQVVMLDDGLGGDALAGDGIYTGSYTVPAGEFDYQADLVAYNTLNYFGRLNNAVAFSTRSIPHLTVSNISLASGTDFDAGIKNYFDIYINNVGPVASQVTTVELSIDNLYIDDYTTQAVSYTTIGASSIKHKNSTTFFIEPSIFTPHGQQIPVTIRMQGYDASSNLYVYEETVTITVIDTSAPDVVASSVTPQNTVTDSVITITAQIEEGTGISYVTAQIETTDGTPVASVFMYDDGLHDDQQDNDYIFAGSWFTSSSPANYHISFMTGDTLANSTTFPQVISFTTIAFEQSNKVLLLCADHESGTIVPSYQSVLDSQAISYDTWEMKYRGTVPGSTLQEYQYGAVFLVTGANGINRLEQDDYDALRTYLASGGNLFASGRHISYQMETGVAAHFFLNEIFSVYSVQQQTGCSSLKNSSTNIGFPATVSLLPGNDCGEVDAISPAFALLESDTVLGGGQTISSATGAFAAEQSTYRAIGLDFALENATNESTKRTIINTSFSWLTDWDNDGLMDAYEFDYFGARETTSGADDPDCDGLINTDEASFDSHPLIADTDNDGHNDRWEFIAGTDPLDASSKLKVSSVLVDNDGVTITWDSVPSKDYSIYHTDQLSTFTYIDTVPSAGPSTSYQDTGSPPDRNNPKDDPSGYYIISVPE